MQHQLIVFLIDPSLFFLLIFRGGIVNITSVIQFKVKSSICITSTQVFSCRP
jgi:hypothetical protein